MMRRVRRLVYRLGVRPRRGSVFYSPSLDLLTAGVAEAFARGFEEGMRDPAGSETGGGLHGPEAEEAWGSTGAMTTRWWGQ